MNRRLNISSDLHTFIICLLLFYFTKHTKSDETNHLVGFTHTHFTVPCPQRQSARPPQPCPPSPRAAFGRRRPPCPTRRRTRPCSPTRRHSFCKWQILISFIIQGGPYFSTVRVGNTSGISAPNVSKTMGNHMEIHARVILDG